MKKILAEIQSGEFAEEFIGDLKSGATRFNKLRQENSTHQIEVVGAELRSMMPFVGGGKKV